MNSILGFGKYLFALPFAVFGIFHFMNGAAMAPMAFGSVALVYITGIALIAATVSILIGKYDKLAAILLAIFLLLTTFLVHLPNVMNAADEQQMGMAMSSLLKDLALAGAALMYARWVARDPAVVG